METWKFGMLQVFGLSSVEKFWYKEEVLKVEGVKVGSPEFFKVLKFGF